MIHLFYTEFYNPLESNSFHSYLRGLPIFIKNKIIGFRNWQDAHRSLLGNILLQEGLKKLNLSEYSLDDLNHTEFQRPYFNNSIDFNISHSGAYIVCAISENSRVGVDIEHVKDISITDFEASFSEGEWNDILQSHGRLRTFYNHWTQKEAFLKAVGVGLNFPLQQICFGNGKIVWKNEAWFSKKIILNNDYACHVVTNAFQAEIILERIDFT